MIHAGSSQAQVVDALMKQQVGTNLADVVQHRAAEAAALELGGDAADAARLKRNAFLKTAKATVKQAVSFCPLIKPLQLSIDGVCLAWVRQRDLDF